MWQRSVTGAELSISPSDAGSFRVTPPLSSPADRTKEEGDEDRWVWGRSQEEED